MNDKKVIDDIVLVEYQANTLQGLIADLHNCCKDRLLVEAQRFNLPQAELKCLLLFEENKYLTGVEIAGRLEIAKSRVSVILDSLQKKGLINRINDPNDARVKLISLTVVGMKKMEEVEKFVFDLHLQLLGHINQSQRNGVISALEVLRSSMKIMRAQLMNQ